MKNTLFELARIRKELCSNDTTNDLLSRLPYKHLRLLKSAEDGISEQRISSKIYASGPSGRSYQLAKHNVIDQLCYAIPFINGGDKVQKEKVKVLRHILTIRILEIFGLNAVMTALARRTLKKCQEFQLWDAALYLTNILSLQYAVFELDMKEAHIYNDLSYQYEKKLSDERQFRWAYSQARNHFRSKGENSDVRFLEDIANALQPKLDVGNMRCYFFYFVIRYTEYYCKSELSKAIETLEEGLAYFNNLSYNHTIAKNYFSSILVQSYMETNELSKAKSLLLTFLENSDKNSHQTFRFKEYLFRITLHEHEYDEAQTLYQYLDKNKNRYNDPDLKDRMLIYEIYLNLLIGKKVNMRSLRYRFNRLKKVKEDVYIPFKIGEVAFMYLYEPNKLFDKLDALNQYTYRNLKNKKYKRTVLFIKIITQIMEGKKYDANQLASSKMSSNSLMEIIDYNYLISFLLSKEIVVASKSGL